jgi:pimeloyl-ACP methyl ester carboxylesterase
MTTTINQPANSSLSTLENDYWRIYHSQETLERGDALRKEYKILSTGVRLHVDAYERTEDEAPILIFNHGGGGYSRLFVPLALALYDKGYTVLCPDQRGQGLSEGSRGDFTMDQFVQNIVDVAQWTRERYRGKLFMAGGSLGGALTYKAAVAGAPVRAIICHNLYDFGNAQDTLAVSRFAPFSAIPGIPALFAATTGWLGKLLPTLRLPYRLLGKFDKMVDRRAVGFYEKWKQDPLPIQWISLRYMASTFQTPPAVPFEQNRIPVLVINQTEDEMVDPLVTERNYQKLGGPKEYVEIPYGHWAFGEAFEQEWATLVDRFLRQF